MKHQIVFRLYLIIFLLIAFSCQTPEPVKEATPETITRIKLTFIPEYGAPVIVEAIDPDGEGIEDILATDSIRLSASVNYELRIEFFNELVEPAAPEYDVTAEIKKEADEHLLLFGWTNDLFNVPSGNGNIDQRSDEVIYLDADGNGLPLGLSTSWITVPGELVFKGEFRIVLKHQPDLKTGSSGIEVGETDLDFTFPLRIN
jgi:hypothetical protein